MQIIAKIIQESNNNYMEAINNLSMKEIIASNMHLLLHVTLKEVLQYKNVLRQNRQLIKDEKTKNFLLNLFFNVFQNLH